MNKQLEQLATDFLTNLPDLIEQGGAYASDLMDRYVKYLLIKESISLSLIIIGVILVIVAFTSSYKWYKKQKAINKSEAESNFEAICFLFLVFSVILIPSCIFKIQRIIKIVYVPEIVIIEEITNKNN